MAKGDGENLVDMSPLPGNGVTDQTLQELRNTLPLLDAAIGQLNKDIDATGALVDQEANFATAIVRIMDLTAGIIGQYMTRKQVPENSPERPNKKRMFLEGLPAALGSADPKVGIANLLTSLL